MLLALPQDAVGEIHLAGHAVVPLDSGQTIRIDDHGAAVDAAGVGFVRAGHRPLLGALPTLIEWDTNIPDFAILAAEAAHAQCDH